MDPSGTSPELDVSRGTHDRQIEDLGIYEIKVAGAGIRIRDDDTGVQSLTVGQLDAGRLAIAPGTGTEGQGNSTILELT